MRRKEGLLHRGWGATYWTPLSVMDPATGGLTKRIATIDDFSLPTSKEVSLHPSRFPDTITTGTSTIHVHLDLNKLIAKCVLYKQ